MTSAKTAAPGRLLEQLAGAGRTGALLVGGELGGVVYLFEGRVVFAESPAAPGVGELLTCSGRLAGRTWQNAVDQGTDRAQVGALLVEQGHLTPGELELCVLGATYDAAYFALATTEAPVTFKADATHWLGPVVSLDPAAVVRESRRRCHLLTEIFPDARIDTIAVTPTTRAPRERITVTAPQWELLVHADGQRTPADLALLLGRAGFATVQELRRLAAAGLIELPPVRSEAPDLISLPRANGTAIPAQRPTFRPDPTVATAPTANPVCTPTMGPTPTPVPTSTPVRTSNAGSAPAATTSATTSARSHSAAPLTPSPRAAPAAWPMQNSGPRSAVGMVKINADVDAPRNSQPPIDLGNANTTGYRPPHQLDRRKPGAWLPKELANEPPPPYFDADDALLIRIRSGLMALR